MNLNDVLLPKWEAWNDMPARNVVLNHGKNGCVVIGSEGICVYCIDDVKLLNTKPALSENNTIVARITSVEMLHNLGHLLPAIVLNEIYTVYNDFVGMDYI